MHSGLVAAALKTVFKAIIVMGFLDFLSTKPKDISIEESREMVFTEFENQEKELLDYSSKKFAEIKYLLISLSKTSSHLETQKINLDEGNKRYRQIVATSQKNLVRQLKGLSLKLVPSNSSDLDSLEEYSQKSLNSVTNDLMPYWKNISLAKLELNKEMNLVGENLKELLESLKELHDLTFAKKLQSLKSLKKSFNELDDKVNEQNVLDEKIKEQGKLIKDIENQLYSLEKSLNEKTTSKDSAEFRSLESKKESFEHAKEKQIQSFNTEIAPAEKVLKRMYSLSESAPLLPSKEKELLRLILVSPSSAFTVDPKGLGAKNIFIKAEKMINDGSIVLKDKEKQKRLNAISSLLEKDFFSDCFWNLNQVQADLIQVRKRLAALNITSQLKVLEADIDSVKNELKEKQSVLERFSNEKQESDSDLDSHSNDLTNSLNSFFEKKFVIK